MIQVSTAIFYIYCILYAHPNQTVVVGQNCHSLCPPPFTPCHEKELGNVWWQRAGQEGEQNGGETGRSEEIRRQEESHSWTKSTSHQMEKQGFSMWRNVCRPFCLLFAVRRAFHYNCFLQFLPSVYIQHKSIRLSFTPHALYNMCETSGSIWSSCPLPLCSPFWNNTLLDTRQGGSARSLWFIGVETPFPVPCTTQIQTSFLYILYLFEGA